MELATAPGVRHPRRLAPAGNRPADDPGCFEAQLGHAEDYLPYRVRVEIERAHARPAARLRPRARGARRRSRSRPTARMPSGSPPTGSACRSSSKPASRPPPARAAARSRPRCSRPGSARSATRSPASSPTPNLELPLLAALTPEHFDVELHRRVREHLLQPEQTADRELVGMLAELDARAPQEEIDEGTAKELLLRLRERGIRRELARSDDLERTKELQAALAKIREAVGG